MMRTPKDLLTMGRDATGLAGLGSITWGSYQIYHPAGFIVGGFFAVTGAVLLTFLDQKGRS
jgi:hypothetical protein